MNEHTPARKAMAYYFVKDHDGRTGKRVTVSTALSDENDNAGGNEIKSREEYEAVVQLAQDRGGWKELVPKITDKYIASSEEKAKKKKEKRMEAKCTAA